MGDIQVIESETGGLKFERAFVLEVNGVPVARAVVGGVLCNIETRPGPLADGLAFCQPVDGTPEDAWEMAVRVRKDGFEETLQDMTDMPEIVAAARRFAELRDQGLAREGVVL